MKPIAFKVRGGGNYSGTKGGTVRPNEKGGTGALWYIDKTFTIASTQDQFIATVQPIISPAITTCKGSRGGCSDEALEEIKAVHAAREQQLLIPKSQPMTTQPNNTPQVPMRFLSVCSGMEAASVAWEPLGWKAVGFSEIEPFPCAILKHRFPNTPNYGSLTEYQQWPLGPDSIDLLVGGTPCQSFSVAGLRKGLADPRGNLALTFLGLADKLRPRWIVWENVPGVLSSGGGRDFGSFLGALEQLGYGWAYRVLDAQHFGVPQRRRRVFVVASLGGWESAASVLLKPESLCWHPAKGRKKGQATAADAGSGVEAGLPRTVGTLCADAHPGAYSGQDAYTGRLIPQTTPVVIDRAAFNQGENAQFDPHIEQTDVMDPLVARGPHADGVRDAGVIPIHDQATRFAGKRGDKQDGKGNGLGIGKPGDPCPTLTRGDHHAVAVPFRKSKRAQSATDDESWVLADASNTLNNFDLGDTRTTHAVVGAVYENHAQDSRITGPLDVAPTVAAKFGTGGGNVPLVNQEQIYENSRRDAIRIYEGTSPTLQSFMGTGGCNVPMVQPAMAVRRLTPTECERLQGFPDNWSRIPWKGKPEDQCPDGPRYKACGNSMAVPVMRWIGEQIARVELSHNNPTE